MKNRKFVVMIIATLVLSLFLYGCDGENIEKTEETEQKETESLEVIESGYVEGNMRYDILKDSKTHVLYLFVETETGTSAISVLLDTDGTPKLDPPRMKD